MFVWTGDRRALGAKLEGCVPREAIARLLEEDDETQRAVLGCTCRELVEGDAELPVGWREAAAEASRFVLINCGEDYPEMVVDLLALAGFGCGDFEWTEIEEEFRAGSAADKDGHTVALATEVLATVLRYHNTFPGTTREAVASALRGVLATVVAGEGLPEDGLLF